MQPSLKIIQLFFLIHVPPTLSPGNWPWSDWLWTLLGRAGSGEESPLGEDVQVLVKHLSCSWNGRSLAYIFICDLISIFNLIQILGSPMEKVQPEVGDQAKCQNFGTNFKFCQNRESRSDYLEVKLFSSKDVKMARHNCEPFLLFNNKRLSWEWKCCISTSVMHGETVSNLIKPPICCVFSLS